MVRRRQNDTYCSIIKDSLRPAVKTTSWLLKIMIPISLSVCLLQYYGVIAWCAQWLNPLFCHIGLPGASSIAFLTGATVTTYAALAVMMTMELTLRQATIIAIMVLICHALPLECTVVKKVGSRPIRMGLLRIAGALLAAMYQNLVLPEMSEPFSALSLSDSDTSIWQVLQGWLMSSLKLSAMIFAIIYALMFIQRLMERYGLMQKLVRPLSPIMVLFGLPPSAAYLWLVGNVLGISYGSAVMIQLEEEGKISLEEADEVNYHLIMNHSMLEDTLVFATAGVSAIWILTTRLLFALILVWSRKVLKTIFK
ncbi:MAG: nucleoside recognition domain-containing protein [Bacteroidaceae bacterium]|nr:nucleoside recognition domain-containing protein [Bacteroidaceae bacterium]